MRSPESQQPALPERHESLLAQLGEGGGNGDGWHGELMKVNKVYFMDHAQLKLLPCLLPCFIPKQG